MYFKIQNFFRDLSLKKFPKKTNILYFDYVDKNSSKIIIQNRDFDYIFSYKKRELNFFLILLIFINFKALKILFFENFTTAYAYMYIFFSRSKIVLTVGDNNLNFYRLKNYYKNIKFVAIQNGSRHRINDIFDFDHIKNFNKKKRICSDLILTFNNSISKVFEKYFCSKTISIGKFINNSIRVFNHQTYTNKIIYISQFRERNFKSHHFKSHGKKVCSIKKFYEVERKLMPILSKYCSKNKFELIIIGAEKSENAKNKEKKFYNLHIGNSPWKYWNRNENLSERYKFVSRFSIIVCSWSTLGVEMFSRNCKVAFFRPRNISPYNDRAFGWPANFPNKGFWYTSFITQLEVDRVLNNLSNIKKNDWISKINLVKNKIMKYDLNNTILRSQLDSILNNKT